MSPLEQKMIESLATHDLQPSDLITSLMTTHTVPNPEYDPVEAKKQELDRAAAIEEEKEEEPADEHTQVLEVPESGCR